MNPQAIRCPMLTRAFTFSSCPKGDMGPNGPVTDFYLGFSIEAVGGASKRSDIGILPSDSTDLHQPALGSSGPSGIRPAGCRASAVALSLPDGELEHTGRELVPKSASGKIIVTASTGSGSSGRLGTPGSHFGSAT